MINVEEKDDNVCRYLLNTMVSAQALDILDFEAQRRLELGIRGAGERLEGQAEDDEEEGSRKTLEKEVANRKKANQEDRKITETNILRAKDEDWLKEIVIS